jgi:hypothetical protein
MLPYGSRNGTRSAEKRVMKYGHSLQVKAMQVQDSPFKRDKSAKPRRTLIIAVFDDVEKGSSSIGNGCCQTTRGYRDTAHPCPDSKPNRRTWGRLKIFSSAKQSG